MWSAKVMGSTTNSRNGAVARVATLWYISTGTRRG